MMEYQKIINLLDNIPNQSTKFRTKNWAEINEDSRGTYNANSQIKFKTSILRSILSDYSDAYILSKGSITIGTQAGDNPNNGDKEVVLKNCVPLTDSICGINNIQIHNATYTDVIMTVYDLIDYSHDYSNTSGSL